MSLTPADRARLGLLLGLGLLAILLPLLERWRPTPAAAAPETEIVVRSSSDSGRGSLRAAILAADRAGDRARIVIRVPRIELEAVLPPLVNPAGVEIAGGGCVVDASRVSAGVVLEVAAPASAIDGLEIAGAGGAGLLVRAPLFRLRESVLRGCKIGVMVDTRGSDLSIAGSTFAGNATGVELAPGAARARLDGNRFERHTVAGLWQVGPEPVAGPASQGLTLVRNHFFADHVSLVLLNVAARVEDNTFLAAGDMALFVGGPGSVIRGNRVRSGAASGIAASGLEGAIIEGNEVEHNRAVGILLKDSRNTVVRANQVYTNGYGIVVVFGSSRGPNLLADNLVTRQTLDGVYVVGGSPVIRGNHLLGNESAGLRLLDYVPESGERRPSEPLLVGNVVAQNSSDEPIHGEYREPRGEQR